jgi:outer membrane receptor protein involved in Fe transport
VVSSGGRASGLKAETSENNTFGIILQPALPTGWGDLSVALDRFDIKVENGVARAGGVAILNRCYDDPAFRAGGGLCRLVSARTSSNALTVNDSYVNLATDVVRGLDLTVRYTNNVWIGRLRVNLNLTRYAFQASKLFADDELDNVNGSLNNPSRTGALEFNYEVKDWRFYFGTEYIGEMSSYEYLGQQDPGTSTFLLKVPSYLTHQASVGYRADKWRLTVGVRNLTNKEPPVISAQAGYSRVGNAPLFSGYDYIGRRVFVTGSRSF